MAEGVGFEPTKAFASPVFKTGAINRSTTLPTHLASAIYIIFIMLPTCFNMAFYLPIFHQERL